MQKELNTKIINNAISAYLMLFISGLFLFNKKNILINNPFVKNHTKTAILIHILFLINFVVFIFYGFLKWIWFLSFSLNYIIASVIFLFLFSILLYWILKASRWEKFKIWDIVFFWKKEKIIDINWDMKLDEKDKLTIILSYIPFIWFIISWEYKENRIIQNIVKLNLLISLIISIFYLFWYSNIWNLFTLLYIVYVVYSSINLISQNEIISLNLDLIPFPENKIIFIKTFFKYLQTYFAKKDFISFDILKKSILEETIKQESENEIILKKLDNKNISAFLVYFPILNIISLAFINTKNKIHIINGIFISLLFVILLIFYIFNLVDLRIFTFLLFPICFWIGFYKTRIAYKMPFIYNIYEIFWNISRFFKKSKIIINEKSIETNIVLKVWEK